MSTHIISLKSKEDHLRPASPNFGLGLIKNKNYEEIVEEESSKELEIELI